MIRIIRNPRLSVIFPKAKGGLMARRLTSNFGIRLDRQDGGIKVFKSTVRNDKLSRT